MKSFSKLLSCFIAVLLLIGIADLVNAQTKEPNSSNLRKSDLEDLHELVGTFFEQISNPTPGPQNALDTLLKSSPFDESTKEEMIKALAEKISGINAQFGNFVSFEAIGTKEIGRDLIVLRYLYKCQNYPLVWYFIFYRPLSPDGETGNKTWQLIHLYYDSQLNIPLWESDF